MIKYTIENRENEWIMFDSNNHKVHTAKSLRLLLSKAYTFEAKYNNRKIISLNTLARLKDSVGIM